MSSRRSRRETAKTRKKRAASLQKYRHNRARRAGLEANSATRTDETGTSDPCSGGRGTRDLEALASMHSNRRQSDDYETISSQRKSKMSQETGQFMRRKKRACSSNVYHELMVTLSTEAGYVQKRKLLCPAKCYLELPTFEPYRKTDMFQINATLFAFNVCSQI